MKYPALYPLPSWDRYNRLCRCRTAKGDTAACFQPVGLSEEPRNTEESRREERAADWPELQWVRPLLLLMARGQPQMTDSPGSSLAAAVGPRLPVSFEDP